MEAENHEKIKKKLARIKTLTTEIESLLTEIPVVPPKPNKQREKYEAFIANFNIWTGRKFEAKDKKCERQFYALIAEGYNYKDFKKAVTNLYASEYHKKDNFVNATPEFITRPDKFSKYLNANQVVEQKKIYPAITRNTKETSLLNNQIGK